ICYGRLSAIFEARTWEIGLLRAVGLSRSTVFVELSKESLLLGAMGTAVGLAGGVAIARFALPTLAATTAINFRLPIAAANTALTPEAMVAGLMVGLGAAVLAAAVPALRLASKQPIAALTMRGREVRSANVTRRSWWIAIGATSCAVALIVLQGRFEHPLIGDLATLAVAIAAGTAAGPLVGGSSALIARLWGLVFGAPGRFATRHLHENIRRATFMVATIGIGIGVVYMFGVLAWSFERTLVDR